MVEEPQREVVYLEEWDEDPDLRPGENIILEDGTLTWERDGFEVRLESHRTTHWRAEVDIPESVGKWYPREIDLKSTPTPDGGFVESVETDQYTATEATLVVASTFQPLREVNAWIDDLLEAADRSEAFEDELTEKLEAARENGE